MTHVWATEVAPLVQRFQQLRPLETPRGIVVRHGRARFRYRGQDRLVLNTRAEGGVSAERKKETKRGRLCESAPTPYHVAIKRIQ